MEASIIIEFLLPSSFLISLPYSDLNENLQNDVILCNADFGIVGDSSESRKSDFPSTPEIRKIIKLKCEVPNAILSVDTELKSKSE